MLLGLYILTTAASFFTGVHYNNEVKRRLREEGYVENNDVGSARTLNAMKFGLTNIFPVLNIYNAIILIMDKDREYERTKKCLINSKQYIRGQVTQPQQQPVQPQQQPVQQQTQQNNQQIQQLQAQISQLQQQNQQLLQLLVRNQNRRVIVNSARNNAPVNFDDLTEIEKLVFLRNELEKLGYYVAEDQDNQDYEDQDYENQDYEDQDYEDQNYEDQDYEEEQEDNQENNQEPEQRGGRQMQINWNDGSRRRR